MMATQRHKVIDEGLHILDISSPRHRPTRCDLAGKFKTLRVLSDIKSEELINVMADRTTRG